MASVLQGFLELYVFRKPLILYPITERGFIKKPLNTYKLQIPEIVQFLKMRIILSMEVPVQV